MTSQGRVWRPKCGQTRFKNIAKNWHTRKRALGVLSDNFWEHFGSLFGTKNGLRSTLAGFFNEKRNCEQILIITIYLKDFTVLEQILKRSSAVFWEAENRDRNRL